MRTELCNIHQLRRELRAAADDHDRLSKLHTVVTNLVNHKDAYGEEKQILVEFRQEIRTLLRCKLSRG